LPYSQDLGKAACSLCHSVALSVDPTDRPNSQQQRRLQANSPHSLGQPTLHPITPFAAQWVARSSSWQL